MEYMIAYHNNRSQSIGYASALILYRSDASNNVTRLNSWSLKFYGHTKQ